MSPTYQRPQVDYSNIYSQKKEVNTPQFTNEKQTKATASLENSYLASTQKVTFENENTSSNKYISNFKNLESGNKT